MPFLFHSLFRNEAEMARNVIEPLERTTVAQFRQFVEYYLNHGYRFVSPADLLKRLSPAELRQFAASRFVHIGNHTANHAILTNYSSDQIRRQIQTAQDDLCEITGQSPIAIAYPNGAHNAQIVEICREIGLQLGVTVRP